MTLNAIMFHVNAKYNYCADGIGSLWMCLRKVGFASVPPRLHTEELAATIAVGVTPVEVRVTDHLVSTITQFKSTHPGGGDLTLHYVDCCPAYSVQDLLAVLKECDWPIGYKVHLSITDHHATNERAAVSLVDAVNVAGQGWLSADLTFKIGTSATMLLHEKSELAAPSFRGGAGLADYLNDYDLWTHTFPGSGDVSAYVSTVIGNLIQWDGSRAWMLSLFLAMESLDRDLRTYGVKQSASGDVTAHPLNVDAVKQFSVTMAAVRDLYINRVMAHVIYHEILEPSRIEIGLVFADSYSNEISEVIISDHGCAAAFVISAKRDGSFKVSGRSKAPGHSFDVSKVAELFGGGGHRSAAGFSVHSSIVNAGSWYMKDATGVATVMKLICGKVSQLHKEGELK